MGKLSLILLFFYILLIENSTDLLGVLFDLGGGLEIRVSLLLKIFFFIFSFFHLINKSKSSIPKTLLYFSSFLLASSFYSYFLAPEFFANVLSVNFHIQLMLNIALFIKLNSHSHIQLKSFYKGLRLFGLINAFLVLISFVLPNLISGFESGVGSSGVSRAFGLMGDEVSLFLTFFFFDSLLLKRYKHLFIYSLSILATGGLGATFVTIILIIYYFMKVKSISKRKFVYAISGFLLVCGILFTAGKSQLQKIGTVKRVVDLIETPDKSSGSLRLISLSTANLLIKERPVLGHGYGSYGFHVKKKFSSIFKRTGNSWRFNSSMVIMSSSFNPYVQMLCEAGILGLLFFFYFLRWIYLLFKSNIDYTNESFLTSLSIISLGWFTVFCFTSITANWFLPNSFLNLLIMALVGIHLGYKKLNFQ